MKTNFWKLINDVDIKEIQIPRLQRNYVQGKRIDLGGNNKVRTVRLMGDRLIEHVLDKLIKKESIDLDFVYGSERDQIIYPLDGQQRLTLLWLVHWYIGIRKGLSEDEKKCLAKFSYATRSSSRLFIKNLIYNFDFSDTPDLTIREQINQYNWFHIEWLFDPTVDSMLNVIEYHIEPKLKGLNHTDLWNYLTEEQNKHPVSIIFTWKNIKHYAKSDDLYIKMNGRGLLLESLDNFRADIAEKFGCDDDSSIWVCGLISKFQGNWSELFWKKLTDDKKNLMYNPNNTKEYISIESNLYELMCRFFLYKSIRDFSRSSSFDCDRIYDFRYHNHLRYTKLDVFFPENGNDGNLREMLEDFESVMEKLEEIENEITQCNNFHLNALISPYWKIEGESPFNIIPNPNKGVECITQKNMVIFFAVMIFLFEASVLPSENCLLWQMWMKLIWNIVNKANINSYETMKDHMNLVNELGKKLLNDVNSFYTNLSEIELVSDSAKEQIQEEKEKAAYRCSSTPDKISQLDELEEEFHGQIYVFYKDERKSKSSINQIIFEERYNEWKRFVDPKKPLRKKTKELLCQFATPWELNRFIFPKGDDHNLYNGAKLIKEYPEICLRLLTKKTPEWSEDKYIHEALLSESLLAITEKIPTGNRWCQFSVGSRYNLYMPNKGGWHIPMDQCSVEIGKKIQGLSREWHNDWDTEWPDWIAEQPNDWKPKCNGYIYYDLTHWRTPIGKEGKIYFYLLKNIFASHEINPSDIDGNIKSDCKSWGINEKVEKLEELLNDILHGRLKFVSIDYGANTP